MIHTHNKIIDISNSILNISEYALSQPYLIDEIYTIAYLVLFSIGVVEVLILNQHLCYNFLLSATSAQVVGLPMTNH